MSGPPFNKLTRRDFIAATLGSMLLAACKTGGEKNAPLTGQLLASGSGLGHMLRDGSFPEPARTERVPVVIIGGGIAGLSAARRLSMNNVHDFVLLELESETGGNSVAGKNALTAYPWAAHYLPLPNPELKELHAFLEEAKVITGYEGERPVFEETFLCTEPHERLFINGSWQPDLVPEFGLSLEDREQVSAFFRLMESYRSQAGSDGKPAFAIPVDASSADPALRSLDSKSMAEFLQQHGWDSPYLRWYVGYCCADDYGTSIENTSAWAGIHYFASRRGVAANAKGSTVLTWPEGNAFLAGKLKTFPPANVRTGHAAFSITPGDDHVAVNCYDSVRKESYTLLADRVICASPQFVRHRLLPGNAGPGTVSYSPWLVANLTVTDWPQGQGQPLSWDNVIYGSQSLGYVDAMHQSLRTSGKRTVLTFYYPFTQLSPAEARKFLHSASHEELTALVIAELSKAHPGAARAIDTIDIRVWGHAMVRPVPGYIWGAARKELQMPAEGKIFFAHSDLGGISIFEEAFYQGLRAADELLASTA